MKVAVLSPVAWRTPPEHYGPWEQMASNLTENLIKLGVEVTLFATGDSKTSGNLASVVAKGYEYDREQDAKVAECLHISNLMEQSGDYDIIHNHFDFLPLTYSKLIKTPFITTIHGFSSEKIIPVYKKYNSNTNYVSISYADRNDSLNYLGNVYNGLNISDFTYNYIPEDYLLFFGRIHHDKGTAEAIEIAVQSKKRLLICGIIQDQNYYNEKVKPYLNDHIEFIGSAGPEMRNNLLGNALALLHPINFNEPFGLSVAESLLCGTPVIAFNKGSMSELIKDKETGFLVNTVEEAVDAVSAISAIQRKACHDDASKRFSAHTMASEYLELYKRI